MYNGKRILSLIPARGGSKGIRNKNIIDLSGQPLISYTIISSLGSKFIDRTVVTTDSKAIADVSKKYGADVPFMRPVELASDESKTIDAVLHAINTLEKMGDTYDVLVLLQPTQPLRTVIDIDRAIKFFFKRNQRGLASVSPVDDNPLLIRSIDESGELSSLLEMSSTCRRQEMPKYYRVNGCLYINQISNIMLQTSFNDNPIGYIMEKSHSVDIDDLSDVVMAEYYLNRTIKKDQWRKQMSSYFAVPVLDEVQEAILDLYDKKFLTNTQTIAVLNLIREKVENYNSDQKENNTCRCGRCLRNFTYAEMFSLEEEVNKITKGTWWSEELDAEVAFDTICGGCRDFIMDKYFSGRS